MAELTLSAIPLCMGLAADCLRGYKVFSEARELGRTSQKLFWKFKIQEARLRIWAREWGLVGQQLGEPADSTTAQLRDTDDYKVVTETLVRVSEVFRDHKQLQTRYGLSLVTETLDLQSSSLGVATSALGESSATDQEVDKLLSKDIMLISLAQMDSDVQDRRNKTAGLYRKLRWAVADRGRFEAMINDLRDYNDGLYSLLSSIERRRLLQALAPEVVPSQNEGVAELRELGGAGNEYAELAPVAQLAAHRLQIEETATPEKLQIDGRFIVFDLPCDGRAVPRLLDRALASYHCKSPEEGDSSSRAHNSSSSCHRTVLVEWKLYDKDLGDAPKREQLQRVDALARLLHVGSRPPALRVPRCLGYIADDWHPRIGFVFEYEGSNSAAPRSLWDVLGGKAIPHVGDRFRLAYELSLSLCILHTAGWLHKGIRSENIVFAAPRGSSAADESSAQRPPRIDQPHLLGFEYARQDSPGAISDTIRDATELTDLYRHPRSLAVAGNPRSRFERAFDVYALGIILLELGFWRRIDEFWHQSYRGRHGQFALDLRTFHAPKLGAKMGGIYMEVVQACLSGDYVVESEPEAGSDGNNIEQNSFFWTVVNRLSKLTA